MNELQSEKQQIQKAAAALKKAAWGYAALLTIIFTVLVPLIIGSFELIVFDSTDFMEDIATGFLVSFIIGALLGLLLAAFYQKNLKAFCSAAGSCRLSLSADGRRIEGQALTAAALDKNVVFGPQGSSASAVNLSLDQITNLELRELKIGKAQLGKYITVYYSGGVYHLPFVEEAQGIRFQALVAECRYR